MATFAPLVRLVERDGAAALVSVMTARGSTPREAGARMIVARDRSISGTIGGGRLEFEAIDRAAGLIDRGRDTAEPFALALGPSIGQCCGGHVTLLIEVFTAARLAELGALAEAEGRGPFRTTAAFVAGEALRRRPASGDVSGTSMELRRDGVIEEAFGRALRPVWLFGAGHVGRAIVLALAPLPFAVTWIDVRADAFPNLPFARLTRVVSERPASELARAPDAAFVLILTHDHGLDLDILHAALGAERFAHVGMIGSATKRARFERRLTDLGHPPERATSFACPIGIAGLNSKEPAIIAASVAADLLLRDQALQTALAGQPAL